MRRLAPLLLLLALAGCATVRNGAACWWATTAHRAAPAPTLPPGPLCVESVALAWRRDGLSCRMVAYPIVGQCPSGTVGAEVELP